MPEQRKNRVKAHRQRRGWSQEELADRARISRAAVSAIEIERIVPSVAAALALASALGCKVEELFGAEEDAAAEAWAWTPSNPACRFWRAHVGGRVLRYPIEPTAAGFLPHDGVDRDGRTQLSGEEDPRRTLVLASCDPAIGWVASEYRRATGYRLLPLQRSSRQALEMLRQGTADVAGIHLASRQDDAGNAARARAVLGVGYSLLRFAIWEEGLAVSAEAFGQSIRSLLKSKLHWVGREVGSGARECQDEVLGTRSAPRRVVRDHRGVVEAIRNGWADVGVCLRFATEEAGLGFVAVREERYDLCFPTALKADPRIRALVDLVRAPAFRSILDELPGCRNVVDPDVGPI